MGNRILCKQGVREGDPLSLFLFILVADALSKLLHRAALKGLGIPTLNGGIKIL